MSFKKKIVLALLFLFAVLLNVFILTHRSGLSDTVEVRMTLSGDAADAVQLYYGNSPQFQPSNQVTVDYAGGNKEQEMVFTIPSDATYLRIDLGSQKASFRISGAKYMYKQSIEPVMLPAFSEGVAEEMNNITSSQISGDVLLVETEAGDPFITAKTGPHALAEEIASARSRNNLIKNILDKDPEAKFLVYGGMGHISDRKGWSMMGGFFKEKTGIDPFTMDCSVMTFSEQYESMDSLRTAFFDRIDAMPVREPIICFDTVKRIYPNNSGMDATCCLPRTRFIEDNIPDWKLYNGKVLYTIDRCFIDQNGFPEGCVSAFLKSEGEQCVPIEQYMYDKDEKEFKLALYKGEYLLRFDDGKEYKYATITIK